MNISMWLQPATHTLGTESEACQNWWRENTEDIESLIKVTKLSYFLPSVRQHQNWIWWDAGLQHAEMLSTIWFIQPQPTSASFLSNPDFIVYYLRIRTGYRNLLCFWKLSIHPNLSSGSRWGRWSVFSPMFPSFRLSCILTRLGSEESFWIPFLWLINEN